APVKLKDNITVVTKSGEQVTGVLYDNNESWIKVSIRRISKTDISDESLALVDDKARTEMIEQYVRRHTAKSSFAEKTFREKKQALIEGEIYADYGYVKQGKNWIPAIDYARQGLAKRRQEAEAKYRESAENKVYLSRGYVKFG